MLIVAKVIVSKDKERVDLVRRQLKENNGYCPCRLTHSDDTKCICKEFREAMDENKPGKCHCGLYEIVKE